MRRENKYQTVIIHKDVVPSILDLRRSGGGDFEIVVAPVGNLRQKNNKKEKAARSIQFSPAPISNRDLPKRRRSFQNFSYLDPSHPDVEDNRGNGYQPTLPIPDYGDNSYDPAIGGTVPFVHSSTYDFHHQLIIPASQREILDVYCDWDMKFRSSKGNEKNVWFSKGPPYPLDMLSFLRNEKSSFVRSSPSPQEPPHPIKNRKSAQGARQPAVRSGSSMSAVPGAPGDEPSSSESGGGNDGNNSYGDYVTPPPSEIEDVSDNDLIVRPEDTALLP